MAKVVRARFELYVALDGWRWRLKINGRVVADSAEAYKRRAGAERGMHAVQRTAHAARVYLREGGRWVEQ